MILVVIFHHHIFTQECYFGDFKVSILGTKVGHFQLTLYGEDPKNDGIFFRRKKIPSDPPFVASGRGRGGWWEIYFYFSFSPAAGV